MPDAEADEEQPGGDAEARPVSVDDDPDGEEAREPDAHAEATARVAPIRSETRPASGNPVTDPTLARTG